MSWIGRFCIGIIIVGLAFIASQHGYRAYERKVAEQASEPDGFTFNEVPVQHTAPAIELPVFRRLPADGQTVLQEIFLEEATLSSADEKEQARQTIASILADYRDNDQLQHFYNDLKQATGQSVELTDLSGENMGELLKQYPQIQPLIAQYAQDPQFGKVLQEIFSNPQFVRSVAVLQQHEPQK